MKNIKKISSGLVGGIILISILWIFVNLNGNQVGYGMSILPLILISILLFAVGFALGVFLFKRMKQKNGR